MRSLLALLAVALMIPPALALEAPKPGASDPHMRQVGYNPLNRTLLVGEIDRETTVTFSPDEQIVRVIFGQDSIWQGPDPKELATQPLKNNLPLWPLKTDRTNLQVTTLLPSGAQRVYQFALSAKKADPDGEDDPEAIFGLIFTYPAEVKQAAVVAWQEKREAAKVVAAKARLAVDVFYGTRNWSYIARPNKAWREAAWPKPEVSDNGTISAFRFVGNVEEPAIYIVTDAGDPNDCLPRGNERLSPFSDKDDLKIIPSVNQHYRLRLGEAVMEVCNLAWDAVGSPPDTGTISPEVVRSIITSKGPK